MRITVPAERAGDSVPPLVAAILSYLERSGGQRTGPPYARTTWAPGEELEVGIPVAEPFEGDGRVLSGGLPASECAVTWHTGRYDRLVHALDALQAWIAEQGLKSAGVPWEFYHSDPRVVTDPNEWQTEVVWPVSGGQ